MVIPFVLRTLLILLTAFTPFITVNNYDYRLYLPQMGGVNQIYAPLATGDINRDGLTDVVFSNPREVVEGVEDSGAVYVFFGKTGQDYTSPDLKITGASASFFGSFAKFIDVNNDGYDDLVLGAQKANDPGSLPGTPALTGCGAAYVVLGRPGFTSTVNTIASLYNACVYGPSKDARFGSSINSNNGDANGDGIDDMLVGASGTNEVYLLLGSASMTRDSAPATAHLSTHKAYSVRFYHTSGTDRSIGTMGTTAFCDIDNDGKDDILIADKTFKTPSGIADAGAVFVKYGSSSFPVLPAAPGISISLDSVLMEAKFMGAESGEGLGSFLDSADIDGDGLRDLILGASTSLNLSNAGKTYLIKNRSGRLLGSIDLGASSNYDVKYTGADTNDNLGVWVYANDINGDGKADLLLGAKRKKTGGGVLGRLYLADGASAFVNKEVPLSDTANYLARFEEYCIEESTTIPDIVYNFYGGIAGDVNGDSNKELYLFDGSTYGGLTFVLLNQKPTVTLTSPNGGETLTGGAVSNITWTAAAAGKFPLLTNPVSLYYSTDGGTNYTLIAADQPNSGTYAWTAPAISNATVRVRVVAKNAIKVGGTAASAANFTITSPNPTVTVLAPNGGEAWPSGSLQQIRWSVDGGAAGLAANPISIHLSLDSGATFATRIAENLANTGTYDWTVPSGLDIGTARIKITALNTLGGSGIGTSARDFAITTATGGGDVRVLEIKSGPSPFSPGGSSGLGAKEVSAAQIDYKLSSTAGASVYIFDSTGNLKWKQEYAAGANGAHVGMNSVPWDGADSGGTIVPNGVYIIKIVSGGKVIGTDKIMIIK